MTYSAPANRIRHSLLCSIIFSILIFTSSAALAGIQIVVRTGDDSPDGNGELSLLNAPSINSAGQLAFVSQLSGTSGGTADNVAMYRRNFDGTLSLIARRGGTYDGKPVISFFPASAYIDSAGTVGSVVAVGPPTEFYHVYYSGGSLVSMYTPAMPSPSGQNNTLLGVLSATINDSGVAVYRAVFNGAQVESGYYQRSANGAQSVRLMNQTPAPRGGTITSGGGRPTLNETNQIGTILSIDVGGPASIHSAARIDGTTVHELAREGDLIGDGITTIGEIRSSSGFVNSAGQVAFAADYTQPSVSRQGVFLADDSGTTLVGPGLLPGGTSATSNMQVAGISDAGRVAFTTEFVAGGSDPASGVYLTGPSGPTIVAFEDTATPMPGKFFRRFFSDAMVLNDAGQLAFLAELSDTVNGAAAGKGIFFYDPVGGLQQVARTGDAIEGSTINTVYFNGTVNGTSTVSPDTSISSMNNAGQVAFSFTLANGLDAMAIWSKPAAVPGDYNANGTVDAADYVLWRETLGQSGANLPADGDGSGTVGPEDYALWRTHFGQSAAAGTGAGFGEVETRNVPEPATLLYMVAGSSILTFQRRKSAIC